MFYWVDITETDTGKIIDRIRKLARFVGKFGELDCHLPDGGILTIHGEGTVSVLYPPLRFQADVRPEDRRIIARDVLEAIG